MMVTTLDAVTILWQRLHGDAALVSEISGGVYKTRPMGSVLEDIEINSLPISNEQLQRGVLNVNIYVPNLVIQSNGNQDTMQPNYARLEVLTNMVLALVEDVWNGDYSYNVQSQAVIQGFNPQIAESYSNIRIDFRNINL